MIALTPTFPTRLISPAEAMPCTTVKNTRGATTVLISLRKISPKILNLVASSGARKPKTIPRAMATTT
ncbi:hypothetical protein D3C78_1587390 [compost metagenome]